MAQPVGKQLNILHAYWSTYSYTGFVGTDVTTVSAATFEASSITGTHGGETSTPTRGIITSGSDNFCKLRKATDGLTIDDSGYQVYARLTYSSGSYRISYKKLVAGVETTATLPSTLSIQMTFPEVMNFGEIPANANIIPVSNTELVTTGSTISGDLIVNGNTTLGDASSDTITLNARLASSLLPSTDNLRSLGSSSLRLADLNSTIFTARGDTADSIKTIYNSSGLTYSNTAYSLDGANILNIGTSSATQLNVGRTGVNLQLNGTVSTSGNLTVTSNLNVGGSLTVSTFSIGNLNVAGNTTLGDINTDTITINGRLVSDIEPYSSDLYSLGSSSKRFLNGHFLNLYSEDFDGYGSIYLGASNASNIYLGNSSANLLINTPISVVATAGEALNLGELVTYSNLTGTPRVYKAEADGYGTKSFAVGAAASTVSAGQQVVINLLGEINVPDSEWDVIPNTTDVGKIAYLSGTSGNWTLIPPAEYYIYNQKCGIVSRGGSEQVRVLLQPIATIDNSSIDAEISASSTIVARTSTGSVLCTSVEAPSSNSYWVVKQRIKETGNTTGVLYLSGQDAGGGCDNGTKGGDVRIVVGAPKPGREGTDSPGVVIFDLGRCASSHGYQSGAITYNDEQGIGVDSGFYGDATGSLYYKWQGNTIANGRTQDIGLRWSSSGGYVFGCNDVAGSYYQIDGLTNSTIGFRLYGSSSIMTATNSLITLSRSTKFTTNVGFYNTTPIAQQTRAGQLTDSTGGSVSSTLSALPTLTDSPATADALRDDLTTNWSPAIINYIASLAAKINGLETIIHNLGLST